MAKDLDEKEKCRMVMEDLDSGMSKGAVAQKYGFLGTVEVLERAQALWEREGYIKRRAICGTIDHKQVAAMLKGGKSRLEVACLHFEGDVVALDRWLDEFQALGIITPSDISPDPPVKEDTE